MALKRKVNKIERKKLLLILLLGIIIMPAKNVSAQDIDKKVITANGSSFSLIIHFRFDQTVIEPGFLNNAKSLQELDDILSDDEFIARIDSISITASASPEGNAEHNWRLAQKRAVALKEYVISKHGLIDQDMIRTYAIGADWNGLRAMVEADLNMPGREDVLDILEQGTDPAVREQRLQQIEGGRAFQYMANNMFRYLRASGAYIIYLKPEQAKPQEITEIPKKVFETEKKEHETSAPDAVITAIDIEPEIELPGEAYRLPLVALKTNMLYNLALIPNIAVELYIGRNWTIEAEGNFAAWKFGKTHNYRVITAGLEVRKWFGARSYTPFNGWFIGAYGMVGTYDFQFGKRGEMSHKSRKTGNYSLSYSAGLSFGYSMPVGRRLNIEYALGAGYVAGKYDIYEYDPVAGTYPWIATGSRHYFGLTKVKVSLVWLLSKSLRNNLKRRYI